MRQTAVLLCAGLVAGCSPGQSQQPAMNVSEELTTGAPINADSPEPAAAATEPSHRYLTHEGELYGYAAAVSEEDQKRGRAAGDVLMFRYEGVHDGVYELTAISGEDRPLYSYECTRPCQAIKVYTWQGIERWAFNPDSVIGAAFIDAFNGQLVPTRRKPAILPPINLTVPASNDTAVSPDVPSDSNSTGVDQSAENDAG